MIQRNRQPGFTLIEIMVVIVIILALIGILIGGIGKFNEAAAQAANRQYLAALQMGLKGYQSAFGDYPPSYATGGMVAGMPMTNAWNGGHILAQAMISARNDDGVMGYGFKSGGATGTSYPGFIQMTNDASMHFTTGTPPDTMWTLNVPTSAAKRPILYYRANVAGATGDLFTDPNAVWQTNGRFITTHNATLAGTADAPLAYLMKTPAQGGPSVAWRKGMAVAIRTGAYLLVAAGADDLFGTADDEYQSDK